MTGPDQAASSGFDRTQEDDHDLLTFGEVGLRLQDAIHNLLAQANALKAADGESAETRRLEKRIAQLQAAAARNESQPITDENFFKFFGYEGKPRRTAGTTPG